MRRTCLTCVSIAAALLAGSPLVAPARAETYVLDKDHTEVRFRWNHLGLSRQSGRFRDVTGTVEFDPAEPEATYADVSIRLASIATGVEKLDTALTRTKEYFDIDTSPAATFRSTEVRRTGGKTGRMIGNLTMNGVARPVTLEVTWNFTGEHPMAAINPVYAGVFASGFSATTQIRRSDWGIDRTIPYVSDEIEITIETEMHRKAPPAAEVGASSEGADAPVLSGNAVVP